MIVVTANGCFDNLHDGHVYFLSFCLRQGDKLVVGINTDEYICRKKTMNMVSAEKRKQELLNLGFVDEVIIFPEDDPCNFIAKVNPQIHCIGMEYKGKAIEENFCKSRGIEIVYVPRVGGWASSNARQKNISSFGC